jgi:predicted dehydrogenase
MSVSEGGARVGVAGAGFIADYHAAALCALGGVRLAWVADPDVRRAEALRERWHFERFGASVAELLTEAPVDVVHVVAPPFAHASIAETCIHAGVHVFVEKPLAATSQDCWTLARLARVRGVTLGVNHSALFQPAFASLVDRIRAGELGAVEHVTASWNMPLPQLEARQFENWMFAQPLNIVLEQAVHPLSQIQFLLGDIHDVSAQPGDGIVLPTDVRFIDQWNVSMIAARGTAQCRLRFGARFYDHWLHVTGEDGAAFADLRRDTLRVTTKSRYIEPVDNFVDGWRSGAALIRAATSGLAAYAAAFLKLRGRQDPFYRGMEASIRGFYQALRAGTEPPATAESGARLVAACEQIAQSACRVSEERLVGTQ